MTTEPPFPREPGEPSIDIAALLESIDAERAAFTEARAAHEMDESLVLATTDRYREFLTESGVSVDELDQAMGAVEDSVRKPRGLLQAELGWIAISLDPQVAKNAIQPNFTPYQVSDEEDAETAEELLNTRIDHKSQTAIQLAQKYGLELTKPLRVLMDNVCPEGPAVAEYSEFDIFEGKTAQEIQNTTKKDAVNEAILAELTPDVAGLLTYELGMHDDITDSARQIIRMALMRTDQTPDNVAGEHNLPAAIYDSYARTLAARFPGQNAMLVRILEEASRVIAARYEGHAKDPEGWEQISFDPTE